ncbi:hypothetical protein [Maribacter polysiphoniae]|uniref:hypothetical protein n=1 Tax=Maribacter polysiphoniae TaxID=429344 RepID=UPI0023524426|nr:hypothetical protein [Maribacter polysiphoniae]
MKNLKITLLFCATVSLFSACTLEENLVQLQNDENSFVNKNKQWLIDNSPFFLTSSFYSGDKSIPPYSPFLGVYNTEDPNFFVRPFQMRLNAGGPNDTIIDNYVFSISFLENDVYKVRECIDGVMSEETNNWEMQFSNKIRCYKNYTGFCSPIIHIKENSNIMFMQQTLEHKKWLEQKINSNDTFDGLTDTPSDGVFENFKFGGADNTIELQILLGYTYKNPSKGEIVLLENNDSPVDFSKQVVFDETQLGGTDLGEHHLLGDISVFSYTDVWGYTRLIYDKAALIPWAGTKFKSINTLNELPEEIRRELLNCGNTTDPCDTLNCVNGTQQTADNGDCFCNCEPGFTGPNCDQPVSTVGVNMQLLAGDGTQGNANGTFGQLNYPQAVATSTDGTVVYIADSGSKSIRMVNPVNNEVTTLLGGNADGYQDGAYTTARFSSFGDIAIDDAGKIYISDSGNHVIRKIADGQVTTYAGIGGAGGFIDGDASVAQFRYPTGLLIRNNIMYVADTENGSIRAIAMNDDPSLRTVSTYAGNGTINLVDGANASASFLGPRDIAYDPTNDRLLITDTNPAGTGFVRAVTSTQTTTLTVDLPGSQVLNYSAGIAVDEVANDGSFYLTDRSNHVLYHLSDVGGVFAGSLVTAGQYQTTGNIGGAPGESRLNFPNLLHIGKSLNSNNQIETRLYITNVLGQSVWYITIRVE